MEKQEVVGIFLAYHIKLRPHTTPRRMQRNQLRTQQILARRNALWYRDRLLALGGDEAVYAPGIAVEGVLLDLFTLSASCSPPLFPFHHTTAPLSPGI